MMPMRNTHSLSQTNSLTNTRKLTDTRAAQELETELARCHQILQWLASEDEGQAREPIVTSFERALSLCVPCPFWFRHSH